MFDAMANASVTPAGCDAARAAAYTSSMITSDTFVWSSNAPYDHAGASLLSSCPATTALSTASRAESEGSELLSIAVVAERLCDSLSRDGAEAAKTHAHDAIARLAAKNMPTADPIDDPGVVNRATAVAATEKKDAAIADAPVAPVWRFGVSKYSTSSILLHASQPELGSDSTLIDLALCCMSIVPTFRPSSPCWQGKYALKLGGRSYHLGDILLQSR